METELRKAYAVHKHSAKGRGIAFELSFPQWLKIWTDSSHLHERGRLGHQYCMARHGDTGPYAIDNVKIITCSQNISEAHAGREPSVAHRRAISKTKTGFTPSIEHVRAIRAASRKRRKLSPAQIGYIRRVCVVGSKTCGGSVLARKYKVTVNVILKYLKSKA